VCFFLGIYLICARWNALIIHSYDVMF
jgi:hypothetical protein